MSGILAELLQHLGGELTVAQRRRVEGVVFDLLAPLPVAVLDVPTPTDPRAATIAAALHADPADGRSLAAWGRHVGASSRTLARVISRETGMGFERWRTHLRIAEALGRLADGATVARCRPRRRLRLDERVRRRLPPDHRDDAGCLLPSVMLGRCGGGGGGHGGAGLRGRGRRRRRLRRA